MSVKEKFIKTKPILRTIALALLATAQTQLPAQSTAFTYQGRLNSSGGLASGNYDLAFTVFDTNAPAGILVAGPITNSTVAVSNGLFMVTLDFGSGIFTGPDRWLELSVRTNGAVNFTTLAPRQPITPTPYAIMANSASNLLGTLPTTKLTGLIPASQLSGTIPAANVSGTYGNVVNLNNGANTFGGSFFGQFFGDGSGLTGLWRMTGNAGTSPTNGNFLGTTDNQPLELRVNGGRALRLEYAFDSTIGQGTVVPNLIGGYSGNYVSNTVAGGFIGGGGDAPYPNRVFGQFGSVLGGLGNTANGKESTAAGFVCTATGDWSTAIGGYCSTAFNALGATALGSGCAANNEAATAIGAFNTADGWISTVLGGFSYANGYYAMAMGRADYAYGDYSLALGTSNTASGNFSVAMGNLSKASHDHSFVWSDGLANTLFSSTTSNQFAVRASGGVLLNAGTNNVEIASGGIKVTGAGIGSSTAVFVHRATGANIEPSSIHRTTINNPYCNGDANAILIVTPNYNPSGTGSILQTHPVGVFYNSSLSKWQIFNEDFVALTTNTAFNVMIVKP